MNMLNCEVVASADHKIIILYKIIIKKYKIYLFCIIKNYNFIKKYKTQKMNQKDILEKLIESVGGIPTLSKLTEIPAPHFYKWLDGTEIRANKLFFICDSAGFNVEVLKTQIKDLEIESECDCKIVNGLLRRGKIKCTKSKKEHGF